MSSGPRSFRPGAFEPAELDGGDGPVRASELAEASAIAREIESVTAASGSIHPSPGFSARVMGAVAREPLPRPARLLDPVRARRDLGGLVQSVRDAWAFATASSRPAGARAMALAYVLAIAVATTSLTGAAAFGAAGALGLFGPRPSPTLAPAPTSPPSVAPSPSVPPSVRPSPSPSVEPSDSPEPSGTDDVNETASPRESDDHAAGGGAGETDHPDATSSPEAPHESDHQDQSSPDPSETASHD